MQVGADDELDPPTCGWMDPPTHRPSSLGFGAEEHRSKEIRQHLRVLVSLFVSPSEAWALRHLLLLLGVSDTQFL